MASRNGYQSENIRKPGKTVRILVRSFLFVGVQVFNGLQVVRLQYVPTEGYSVILCLYRRIFCKTNDPQNGYLILHFSHRYWWYSSAVSISSALLCNSTYPFSLYRWISYPWMVCIVTAICVSLWDTLIILFI